MHIVHLVGRSHRRGAEQVAMELAAELDQLGHRNQILAVGLGHEGDRDDALPPLVAATGHGPPTLARAALAARSALRHDQPDAVIAHGAAAALVAASAWPRHGPVIVWQTIAALAEQSQRGVQRQLWRVALHRIDAVVALTSQLGDEVVRLGFSGRVELIGNARRTQRFEGLDRLDEGRRLRAVAGVDESVGLIGLVGYLVDQKRPERAVEVLAQLRAGGCDVHLVVAGGGPLAADLEARVGDLGVDGHITMLGHRADVEIVLAGLDVLILTSDDEGVPGIFIEAAMAGCPVVTYPIGGVVDVVDDQVTGIVLAAGTVGAMVAAVSDLLADPGRRTAMGDAALRRSGDFSMEKVAKRYEALVAAARSGS